jgi:hypothetical protein
MEAAPSQSMVVSRVPWFRRSNWLFASEQADAIGSERVRLQREHSDDATFSGNPQLASVSTSESSSRLRCRPTNVIHLITR